MNEFMDIARVLGGGTLNAVTMLAALYIYNSLKAKRNGNGTRSGDITKDKIDLTVLEHKEECSNAIHVKMDTGFMRLHDRLDKIMEKFVELRGLIK